MSESWHMHFGIYGIAIRNNEMLLIEKNGGPYTGRYDLPGGSLENMESIEQCLHRELLEEARAKVKIVDNLGGYDFLVNSPYNGCKYTHHIAMFYKIEVEAIDQQELKEYVVNRDELIENDSKNCNWIDISSLNIDNSSPLVMKACEIIKNGIGNNKIGKFLDWKIK